MQSPLNDTHTQPVPYSYGLSPFLFVAFFKGFQGCTGKKPPGRTFPKSSSPFFAPYKLGPKTAAKAHPQNNAVENLFMAGRVFPPGGFPIAFSRPSRRTHQPGASTGRVPGCAQIADGVPAAKFATDGD